MPRLARRQRLAHPRVHPRVVPHPLAQRPPQMERIQPVRGARQVLQRRADPRRTVPAHRAPLHTGKVPMPRKVRQRLLDRNRPLAHRHVHPPVLEHRAAPRIGLPPLIRQRVLEPDPLLATVRTPPAPHEQLVELHVQLPRHAAPFRDLAPLEQGFPQPLRLLGRQRPRLLHVRPDGHAADPHLALRPPLQPPFRRPERRLHRQRDGQLPHHRRIPLPGPKPQRLVQQKAPLACLAVHVVAAPEGDLAHLGQQGLGTPVHHLQPPVPLLHQPPVLRLQRQHQQPPRGLLHRSLDG